VPSTALALLAATAERRLFESKKRDTIAQPGSATHPFAARAAPSRLNLGLRSGEIARTVRPALR
jgi:hypothetical protein